MAFVRTVIGLLCCTNYPIPTSKASLLALMQVKELDPTNALAMKSVQRLTPVVEERREKMKEEMLGEWTLRSLFACSSQSEPNHLQYLVE
jgi:hypothetical protein